MTAGEMREAEKRGPYVDWDMFSPPVVAAGDCHMMAAGQLEYWRAKGGGFFVCAQAIDSQLTWTNYLKLV